LGVKYQTALVAGAPSWIMLVDLQHSLQTPD